jgi:hypothetical protein
VSFRKVAVTSDNKVQPLKEAVKSSKKKKRWTPRQLRDKLLAAEEEMAD